MKMKIIMKIMKIKKKVTVFKTKIIFLIYLIKLFIINANYK